MFQMVSEITIKMLAVYRELSLQQLDIPLFVVKTHNIESNPLGPIPEIRLQ